MKGQYSNLNLAQSGLPLTPHLTSPHPCTTYTLGQPVTRSSAILGVCRKVCFQKGIECCLGTMALEGLFLGCSPRTSGAPPPQEKGHLRRSETLLGLLSAGPLCLRLSVSDKSWARFGDTEAPVCYWLYIMSLHKVCRWYESLTHTGCASFKLKLGEVSKLFIPLAFLPVLAVSFTLHVVGWNCEVLTRGIGFAISEISKTLQNGMRGLYILLKRVQIWMKSYWEKSFFTN